MAAARDIKSNTARRARGVFQSTLTRVVDFVGVVGVGDGFAGVGDGEDAVEGGEMCEACVVPPAS